MSSITNIYLHYATNLDSHYKTIDDYIMEKRKKNNNNDNDSNNDKLNGVKSSHEKYYDMFYQPENKRLPFRSKYVNQIRDNITKCPKDYSDQIKNILKNNNMVSQFPGYTDNDLLHELRYVNNTNRMKNTKYNRTIPFPVNSDFFK
tara:strand:+ start:673 stop:1110 length:438 start_codon:yes stop_codon:yes gene_type:complete